MYRYSRSKIMLLLYLCVVGCLGKGHRINVFNSELDGDDVFGSILEQVEANRSKKESVSDSMLNSKLVLTKRMECSHGESCTQ